MKINGARVPVEFKVVNTPDLPPIVISQNENDNPKVVINTHHKIWISLHRRTIAGIIEAMQEKMDIILDSHLEELRNFELEEAEWE
tara:strand:+ start:161 stop:418 length:258 start_codon:yes stop_codon:yes gene_type:complete